MASKAAIAQNEILKSKNQFFSSYQSIRALKEKRPSLRTSTLPFMIKHLKKRKHLILEKEVHELIGATNKELLSSIYRKTRGELMMG